jgi:hypothetical protein
LAIEQSVRSRRRSRHRATVCDGRSPHAERRGSRRPRRPLILAHLVAEEVEAGLLTRLLPEWKTTGGLMHAVFPSRRGMVPAVRVLLDFLVARFDLPELPTKS